MKWRTFLPLLAIVALALFLGALQGAASRAGAPAVADQTTARLIEPDRRTPDASYSVAGPFVSQPVAPAVFNGDLRDLPQLSAGGALPPGESREIPLGLPPGVKPSATVDRRLEPVAQTMQGSGQMPAPIITFEGVSGPEAGGWAPPDTNGDVGPNHYIQTVNIGIGIYSKTTGVELVNISYNDFFDGTGTSCDNNNRGDPVALYDPLADRWIITDFSLPSGGPFLECIAISQSGDPVSGGWYFYALNAGNASGSWHDYPKLGVWPDAYYMSANMFDPAAGAKVWALDRAAMLNGDPLTAVSFDLGSAYWSLLPANLRGDPPPAGSPNYFASINFPNQLYLWEFHVDWVTPGNSTLTGPTALTVADIDFIWEIPQPSPGVLLDSLGDRLMMQLQYRNLGEHESLWVNHTVASGGVAGVRWYEVRDPGGAPILYQQGTYQPDDQHRWMASLAVDQDGNMAVGYSVSSDSLYPGIRYAGRLAGEPLGVLPQSEASLIEGSGVQLGTDRWGDYSAMSVDPLDDCTFWYTQEYYETSSSRDWQTRIGAFKFPSCGQPKGWITGRVYDAGTLAGIPGVFVVAEGLTTTLTVETDANGHYTMTLPGAAYTLTAGPLLPAYPDPASVTGTLVTAGLTVTQDISLAPYPYLTEGAAWVDDAVTGGNANGYPEPGESELLLWETLSNTGATTATNVTAQLIALSPGVTVTVAAADYPDIAAGQAQANLTPFVFSIAPTVTCGARLDFAQIVAADQGVYTVSLSLYAMALLPPTSILSDDVESGAGNWVTGGTNNHWAISEEQAHSPTHAWSDSPGGNYQDNTNAWLRSPVMDFTGKVNAALSFWQRYDLETGWDFGYLEYSLDGGANWEDAVSSYSGVQTSWERPTFNLPALDNQADVAFRFRLSSDTAVTTDGWYIDDVDLSYQPFECTYPVAPPGAPVPVAPADGTLTTTQAITLSWEAGPGAPPQGYNLELDGAVITTSATSSATLLSPGLHTWRVRAFNALGYSDYSASQSVEIVTLPGAPALITPPDGTITTTQNITFRWMAGTGGTPAGYNLELNGGVLTLTQTSLPVFLSPGAYTWRVRAFNMVGYSAYSELYTVEILGPAGVPILLSPPDEAITDTFQLTFTWQAGSGGTPAGYNLELDGAVFTTTQPSASAVLTAGPHTWRVRAFNALGYSAYSAARTVTLVQRVYLPLILRNG